MATFSVDTKLFRELGALLVGRESTALVELIKNAYDADATEVTILGDKLGDLAAGSIIVSDNGVGMSETEFSRGFLRIAGRSKAEQERRSPWFKRPYTGEKGVGRLAAHKLAHRLKVVSRRWDEKPRDPVTGFQAKSKVVGTIDWDAIERLEELSEIPDSGAVRVAAFDKAGGSAGTRLTLSPLRKAWTDRDLASFFDEVATLTPPSPLTAKLAETVVAKPVLMESLVPQHEGIDSGFRINFAGQLRISDSDLPAPAESADWIIEIECDVLAGILKICVAPTVATVTKHPEAEPYHYSRAIEPEEAAVGFKARILQRRGLWPSRFQGVRVYYEGFRVLPYGDKRDDWLSLDQDYRSRKKEFGRLQDLSEEVLAQSKEAEALRSQGNPSFFGAVLLTRAGAPELQMLVNREGFVPSAQFEFVTDVVRLAIDLQVRVRVAATLEHETPRNENTPKQEDAAARSSSGQSPTAFALQETHELSLATLNEARTALSGGDSKKALVEIEKVEKRIQEAVQYSREASSEATMFRVVATIGLEQTAFIHEVRSIALVAQSLAENLETIAKRESDSAVSSDLRTAAAEAREVRDRLRRNAVYLADMTGIEARRRRQRLILKERVERVLSFFANAISRAQLNIVVDVPPDLRTPPLFPAEITAILTNLVSNAIKFAGNNGQILIRAGISGKHLELRLENTGAEVDLGKAERWFSPFQSTTTQVDEALGQGMGLGLTITRSLLDEYGGHIHFVAPSTGYMTAIELELPNK